jgi:hypothetical protein
MAITKDQDDLLIRALTALDVAPSNDRAGDMKTAIGKLIQLMNNKKDPGTDDITYDGNGYSEGIGQTLLDKVTTFKEGAKYKLLKSAYTADESKLDFITKGIYSIAKSEFQKDETIPKGITSNPNNLFFLMDNTTKILEAAKAVAETPAAGPQASQKPAASAAAKTPAPVKKTEEQVKTETTAIAELGKLGLEKVEAGKTATTEQIIEAARKKKEEIEKIAAEKQTQADKDLLAKLNTHLALLPKPEEKTQQQVTQTQTTTKADEPVIPPSVPQLTIAATRVLAQTFKDKTPDRDLANLFLQGCFGGWFDANDLIKDFAKMDGLKKPFDNAKSLAAEQKIIAKDLFLSAFKDGNIAETRRALDKKIAVIVQTLPGEDARKTAFEEKIASLMTRAFETMKPDRSNLAEVATVFGNSYVDAMAALNKDPKTEYKAAGYSIIPARTPYTIDQSVADFNAGGVTINDISKVYWDLNADYYQRSDKNAARDTKDLFFKSADGKVYMAHVERTTNMLSVIEVPADKIAQRLKEIYDANPTNVEGGLGRRKPAYEALCREPGMEALGIATDNGTNMKYSMTGQYFLQAIETAPSFAEIQARAEKIAKNSKATVAKAEIDLEKKHLQDIENARREGYAAGVAAMGGGGVNGNAYNDGGRVNGNRDNTHAADADCSKSEPGFLRRAFGAVSKGVNKVNKFLIGVPEYNPDAASKNSGDCDPKDDSKKHKKEKERREEQRAERSTGSDGGSGTAKTTKKDDSNCEDGCTVTLDSRETRIREFKEVAVDCGGTGATAGCEVSVQRPAVAASSPR